MRQLQWCLIRVFFFSSSLLCCNSTGQQRTHAKRLINTKSKRNTIRESEREIKFFNIFFFLQTTRCIAPVCIVSKVSFSNWKKRGPNLWTNKIPIVHSNTIPPFFSLSLQNKENHKLVYLHIIQLVFTIVLFYFYSYLLVII